MLIVKRPDMFGFRNPGLMRIPVEQAIRGGESDCRNHTLHKMFMLIGLSERAGSGVHNIYRSWASQDWRQPQLHEKQRPEQTLLALKMLNLFPEEVINALRTAMGKRFDALSELERLILVTAAVEQVINHSRIKEISDVHPHDLSLALSKLVKDKVLLSEGSGRGTVYYLPGTNLPTPEDAFSFQPVDFKAFNETTGAEPISLAAEVTGQAPEVSGEGPVVSGISAEAYSQLQQIAEPIRNTGKAPKAEMEAMIIQLCQHHYLTRRVIAELVDRSADFLRKDYLNPMVRNKQLELAYPTKPNHPDQGYRSRKVVNKNRDEK